MANVDQQEIAKFSEIADKWWDVDGEFKPLHKINPLRVDYVERQANGLFGKRVLDVGCGGGILAEALSKHGAQVTGVDMAEASLEIARTHAKNNKLKINYECITAEDLAQREKATYDVVTCLEMLEHVPKPESIVRACSELIKPGGTLVLSTINRNFKSYLMAIVAAEYVLGWVPKETHDFQKFIKPHELMKMCDNAELSIIEAIGMHYNPLLSNFSLSKQNIDVNYFVTCVKNP